MALNAGDPRFQKTLLAGLVLVGVLYAYFFTSWVPFTYKANASQVGDLEVRYRDMSKDLNKARQAAHRLPYLEKEYQLLHQKWEQSRSLLPEQQDVAWLLRTITLLGTQTGVEFALFRPLPPKPAQYHTENPIEIKVVGGYHEVGAFLAEMANLDRIINVTNLDLETNKIRDPDKPAEASFTAVTYTLGGTGVPPEQAQPGKRGAPSPPKDGREPAAGEKGSGSLLQRTSNHGGGNE